MKPARPRLIPCSALGAYVDDDRWAWEPKLDGHRCILTVSLTGLTSAMTRHGQPCRVPDISALTIPPSTTLDGELMPDGQYIVFDFLELAGELGCCAPLSARRARLEDLFPALGRTRIIQRVDPRWALTHRLHEGVVLKLDAPYPYGETTKWLRARWAR